MLMRVLPTWPLMGAVLFDCLQTHNDGLQDPGGHS